MFINDEFYDYTCMSIDTIEFPNIEDIKKEYVLQYGEDFDKLEINI